ncbi:MAG TPA: ATP-binding protein [Thermoanaerobaculia bacterium]|nr:ATP-binding protein [Thermoanaerobaculia bacterium]
MNSIFRKGLLLIAAPLLFQAIFLGVLIKNERDSAAAERWALHGKQVISQAETAMRTLVEESNRMRGLVITGNPAFATPPTRAVIDQVEELHRLVGDNPAQEKRAAALGATAERLLAWFASQERLVEADRAEEAARRIRTLQGDRLLKAAQAELTAFLTEEQRLDRERQDLLAQTRRRQRWLLLAASIAAAATALLMAWLFSKNVSSRLEVVAANARRLAENAPLSPLLGGEDEIAELDSTFHQTAFRLAEAAAAERLFQAELERRAAELAAANEDLRYKTQEIETFVYSVSHDLRSPLVNLQGFSRELERSCGDLQRALAQTALPPGVRRQLDAVDRDMAESVRFIQTAVSRSANIIDALLRLSRAGRVEYQWQSVPVDWIVRRVVDAMRGSIEQKRVEVTIGPLPPAWGDPTAVEQIFGNLLSNAVNYLDPDRPGRIEIGATNGQPDFSPTYWVRDNGLGIPESYQGKLFVAFQRLHGNVAPGEGIGLALVRRVVERHGGRIWAESREGEGTTFFLTLPGSGGEDRMDARTATTG